MSQYAILATRVIPMCKIINIYELYKIESLTVVKINLNGHDRTKQIQAQFDEFVQFNCLYYSKLYDLSISFVSNVAKKDPNNE